jgi:phosphate-selective porin OprO/OprP
MIGVLVVAVLLLSVSASNGQTGSSGFSNDSPGPGEILEEAEKGKKEKITGFHLYWEDGLHVESRKKNVAVKIGGKILGDGGTIDADQDLKTAFPDLDGSEADFRRLSVSVSGTIKALSAVGEGAKAIEKPGRPITGAVASYAAYDAIEFKSEIDFANVRDVKDNWLRFTGIPFLRPFRFGHLKEPFSLESLVAISDITFMERALPTDAFRLGRNMGIRYDQTLLNERIALGAGWFLNTGSLGDVGEATDRISEANGYNLTARITGIPWYEEEEGRLVHLGLSYTHGVRDDDSEDDRLRFRPRPESRLTDERLVDTGSFFADRIDRVNPELAIALGPFSLQGEYFYAFTDAKEKGDPRFWGYYLSASYFLSGENRSYDKKSGIFSRVKPIHSVHPRKHGWGAWEVALRYSYVDLNDEGVKGGKESNFTAGLNWYLNPHYRFMLNYVRADVDDRADPLIEDGRADILQARFQIVY